MTRLKVECLVLVTLSIYASAGINTQETLDSYMLNASCM